jgi:hypothetical protein
MGWLLVSTLTLLGVVTPSGVSSCDGGGCCEGNLNKTTLTAKVEVILLSKNVEWVLLKTLTLVYVSSYHGDGCCEGN